MEGSGSSSGGSDVFKQDAMAMRPWGSIGGCVAALADGKVSTVGALSRQIGNWVGPSWGKGWALAHDLNIMSCQQVSSGISIVSGLLTGGLKTQPNKVAKGG